MPETKAHFYDVFCSIFFNQQVLEETEGCSLQAVAPGAAVLIEKKKSEWSHCGKRCRRNFSCVVSTVSKKHTIGMANMKRTLGKVIQSNIS